MRFRQNADPTLLKVAESTGGKSYYVEERNSHVNLNQAMIDTLTQGSGIVSVSRIYIYTVAGAACNFIISLIKQD